jgi:hypothetical protein
MDTQTQQPSRIGDTEAQRKWMPILVPSAAAVIMALIFLAMWFVLYRP